MNLLREELPRRFPGVSFYFQSADIMSQVLNFGVPAPIDVQIEGPNLAASAEVARRLETALRQVPGAVDVRLKQVVNAPAYRVEVDRLQAARLGLTQQAVANGLLVGLSGNGQLAPSFYLDPVTGVNYTVAVKAPLSQMTSPQALMATPFSLPGGATFLQSGTPTTGPASQPPSEPLSNFASLQRMSVPNEVNHATVQRVMDVMASVEGRDLGAVAGDIQRQIQSLGQLPPATRIHIRGQFEVMTEAFRNLGGGLIIAIVLVYLLMAVLYQSWLDPFIILFSVPAPWWASCGCWPSRARPSMWNP